MDSLTERDVLIAVAEEHGEHRKSLEGAAAIALACEPTEAAILEAIGALQNENTRVKAVLDERWPDFAKAYLEHIIPKNGGFEMALHGQATMMTAEMLAAEFKAAGGESYLTLTFSHPELGPMALNIQRVEGELPAVQNVRLRKEMEAIRGRDPMDFQGVLMAVQCGGVSTGRARELLRDWLAGLPANPPPDDTPNPFGMDDNPAEICTELRQVVKRCRDQFLFYETQHRAKGTPEADAKADVNRDLAALCTAALAGD